MWNKFSNIAPLKTKLTDMKKLFYISLLTFAALGCTDEKIDDGRDLTENEQVNTYIREEMTGETSMYLWTEEIVGKSYTLTAEPEVYLSHMRHEDDEWSSVEKDPLASRAESNENDDIETGYGWYLVNYQTQDGLYFSYVAYVYPNSPAAEAGLKRGDIITQVDGAYITGDFSKLYNSSSVKVGLGRMEGNAIYPEPQATVSLTAANTQIDPVLVRKVLDVDGKKVGYLHYTRFVYTGDDDLDHLTTVFRQFKQEGVQEFILDLRYNPGGYEMAAQRLATLLAPAAAVENEEILLTKQWNALWQEYYETHGGVNLETRFDKSVPANARLSDLERLWVITGPGTASSSEVVINGLKPFYSLRMKQVGDKTYGKYVGGLTRIPEDEEISDWRLTLITCSDVNSEGTSVKGGLLPDIPLDEDISSSAALGDESEYLLSMVLAAIRNLPTSIGSRSTSPFTRLPETQKPLPMLIIPQE